MNERKTLNLGMLAALAAGVCCSAPALSQEGATQGASSSDLAQSFYVEIPSAGSTISNLMFRSGVGKARWMNELKSLMAMGAEARLDLAVGGKSESVTIAALKTALNSFGSQRLPFLKLTFIGGDKGEDLREQAEALGIDFRVVSPTERNR